MNDRFGIVVACDLNRGIGKNNQLPWRLSADLKYFKQITSTTTEPKKYNAVIMGRKTWESIPPQHRPLPNRYNIVLTRNPNYPVPQGVFRFASLDETFEKLQEGPIEQVFIIGGAEIYNQAIQHERIGFLHLTEIRHRYDCDTFFPDYKQFFQLISSSEIQSENGIEFCFKVYKPNLLG
ncbi:MAG: dihydrofolate reductase [Candidatus Obscuribacterales bacterium]|nr:dihydrofolate reductase [Candidatus Obscuribacterales bacterium]